MFQIFARFIKTLNGILASHGTRSQTGKLREYEPHPVCFLPAAANFGKRLIVHSILRLNKTLEIVILQASTFMPTTRPSV